MGLHLKDSTSLSFSIYKQHVFVSYSVKTQTFQLLNELELIQELKSGDEASFKYLVDTYQDRIFNTAIGIVQNAEDAEDVGRRFLFLIDPAAYAGYSTITPEILIFVRASHQHLIVCK